MAYKHKKIFCPSCHCISLKQISAEKWGVTTKSVCVRQECKAFNIPIITPNPR